MASLKTLVIFMVCFAYQVSGSPVWKEYFSVQVREGKADFIEKVEIDMVKRQTYVHVPAHNTLQETETLSDIKNGHSILCYKRDGYCILRQVEDTGFGDIDALKRGMENVQIKGGQMSANASLVVHQYLSVSLEPITDLSFLTSDAITFLGGRPLHNSTTYKLPPNAKFLADSAVDKGKQKRALQKIAYKVFHSVDSKVFTYVFRCEGGKMPEDIWGYTASSACEYINVCGYDKYNHECPEIHFTQRTLLKCSCCPGVYVKSKCLCSSPTAHTRVAPLT
ncbi:uncharacterized protein LOC106152408 [Lingula anatina]|uniref:Uncharacterized protein LOC106152408 n=1 Tax=Lingula anatina TaxID=7574 RepID=A0A1S3H5Z1_LINAN|nr:uncharacterized protein LOC106152408 [Lingula anatina]|eukprot:XP_013381418.1 uncharacterized protein LOC106152408 [Lingula anatina]